MNRAVFDTASRISDFSNVSLLGAVVQGSAGITKRSSASTLGALKAVLQTLQCQGLGAGTILSNVLTIIHLHPYPPLISDHSPVTSDTPHCLPCPGHT